MVIYQSCFGRGKRESTHLLLAFHFTIFSFDSAFPFLPYPLPLTVGFGQHCELWLLECMREVPLTSVPLFFTLFCSLNKCQPCISHWMPGAWWCCVAMTLSYFLPPFFPDPAQMHCPHGEWIESISQTQSTGNSFLTRNRIPWQLWFSHVCCSWMASLPKGIWSDLESRNFWLLLVWLYNFFLFWNNTDILKLVSQKRDPTNLETFGWCCFGRWLHFLFLSWNNTVIPKPISHKRVLIKPRNF